MPISGTATYVSGTTWLLDRSCDFSCSFCSFRDPKGTWKTAIDDVSLPTHVQTGDVVELMTGNMNRSNPWLRRHVDRLVDACELVLDKQAFPVVPATCVPASYFKHLVPHIRGVRLHVDVFAAGDVSGKAMQDVLAVLQEMGKYEVPVSIIILIGAGETSVQRQKLLEELYEHSEVRNIVASVVFRPYFSFGGGWQPAYQLTPASIGESVRLTTDIFHNTPVSVQISGVSDWWLLLDEGLQDFDILRSESLARDESGSIFVPPLVQDVERVLHSRNMLLAERNWDGLVTSEDLTRRYDGTRSELENKHQTNLF